MKIIHLSDLHVTGGSFVPEWGDAVVACVGATDPDLTIVTGDLTSEGHVDEYEKARAYVARLKTRSLLMVPGNHDARNEGYVLFEEMFGTRYPVYENETVAVCGIDSSQPDIDDGHVGRSNYSHIVERLSRPGKTRILAMHHHLIPIPGTGRERHIPTDAGDVLKLCVDNRIGIVLSGHKHLPYIWNLEDTHFITAGTATSRRLKGRSCPSFNIITVEPGTFVVEQVNVAAGTTQRISLPVA
jgi:3',5'-cyclic AMP phosphodiesterase CpdA